MQHVIGDFGNLHNNIILLTRNASGVVASKSLNFPSFRAVVTGNALDLPGGQEVMDYMWSEWRGQRWVFGDVAMKLGKSVEMHMGETRVGDDLQRHAVAYAAAMLGVKEGEVALTLFLPPGMYKARRQDLVEAFQGKEVEIALKGDKKPRRWTWGEVTVLAEGAAAVACLLFDKHGQRVESEYLDVVKGRTDVLDGGGYTFDKVNVINGFVNADEFDYASAKGFGLFAHVIKPLLRLYAQRWSYINAGHIDSAIRNGLGGGEFILDPENIGIDIAENVASVAREYGENVLTYLATQHDNLMQARHVLLVGGWAHPLLCGTLMRERLGAKLINPAKLPHLKGVEPVNMNVIGAERRARHLMMQAGETPAKPVKKGKK